MTKLYRVQTTVDELHGRRDVQLTWLASRDWPPVPYHEVVAGVDAGDEVSPYRRSAVDELFTFEEAEAWVAYLKRWYGDESANIWEYPLPVSDEVGLRVLPLGGGVDQIIPEEEPDYPFTFAVRGYYDLRQHEEAPTAKSQF